MKIKDITDVIETFAPLRWQESYDNAGLVVGREEDEVHAALLAVDVTEEVLDEAERTGCDLVITHPTELHFMQINSNTDYERYNLLIPLNHPLTRLLFKIPRNLDVLNCSNHTIIKENFKRMPFYEKIFPKDEFQDLLSALLTEILYNILALDDNFNQQQNVVSPLIQKALAYINEHLFTIKNISEISNALFVAQNYFFRLFKETLNISPKKYITTKRLLHAQSLLRAGKKPTQIYEQIGFSNYVSFYQQYVALFGYSPSSERVIV